ncbi:MAG TPA: sigma-70 family RNA polymerase sigma factor [Candidatus Limnocylindrales bacterium]|nr:sigma-70 family RNA polymerase sigma factor [Candidatus Limnocylindrales bacterium]
MPEAENHLLPGATNDTWRAWLMTGVQRAPADRRRIRGANKGLKRMLLEGTPDSDERPHAWRDFSGAMIRHGVEEAMRDLPQQDKQVVKLAYFGGYSNREIAEQVGLTETTVQRRLRRALSTISDHIQRGRAVGRRAAFALLVWLSGRSLHDSAHHVVQVAVVAGATMIIVVQPAAAPVAPDRPGVIPAAAASVRSPAPSAAQKPAEPPIPLPATAPALPGAPAVPALPGVPAVPALPALPSVPVHVAPLPINVPPLPTPPTIGITKSLRT